MPDDTIILALPNGLELEMPSDSTPDEIRAATKRYSPEAGTAPAGRAPDVTMRPEGKLEALTRTPLGNAALSSLPGVGATVGAVAAAGPSLGTGAIPGGVAGGATGALIEQMIRKLAAGQGADAKDYLTVAEGAAGGLLPPGGSKVITAAPNAVRNATVATKGALPEALDEAVKAKNLAGAPLAALRGLVRGGKDALKKASAEAAAAAAKEMKAKKEALRRVLQQDRKPLWKR